MIENGTWRAPSCAMPSGGQLLCRLMHPNIVSARGFERDPGGQLFLVMEYVDGMDLATLLDRGPLPHAVIVFIVAEILSGLGRAHDLPIARDRRGVAHRDLSPHNILRSREGGAVKVADFGLAKLTVPITLRIRNETKETPSPSSRYSPRPYDALSD